MIHSIADIQTLIRAGESDWKQYGEVAAAVWGGYILFNYTQAAQFMGRWNWFELNSRGLIFNHQTGEIVARPFRKFFNYGERMPVQGTYIVEVTEKMDGSLGILYRDEGQYRIATRGSFTSEQALWATAYLSKHHDMAGLDDALTLMFEIIYPANRVVVNYGDFQGLVLIGARNRHFGQELYAAELDVLADQFGFLRPKVYDFTDPADILQAAEEISTNEEGWVLRYSDNERYKIKGVAYKLAHRIMTGASFNRVLDSVSKGQFEAMIEGVPDEFLAQVKLWRAEIDETLTRIQYECRMALTVAPQDTQKAFALWVQGNYSKDMWAYLFAAKSGKPLEPIIYKNAFENRRDGDRTLTVDEA